MPLFRKKEKDTDELAQASTPIKVTEFEIADWRKAVTLKEAEYVILEAIPTSVAYKYISIHNVFKRLYKYGFVLTNQRLITLAFKHGAEKDGRTEVTFELEKEFPLENIKDVTLQGEEIVIYTDEGKSVCGVLPCVTGLPYHKDSDYLVRFNYFREKIIRQKEKRASVTLNFSSLKSLMEKGGIVLTTLTCPKCNASIKLPADGAETICQYCGSIIYAQDIFKKLKSLLS